MAQLYVIVPGKEQPELLEVDEVVRRIKAGELPDTANVAPLGETTWTPAKEVPEIAAGVGKPVLPSTRPSLGGASPSEAGTPSPFATPPPKGAPDPLNPFAAQHTAASKAGAPNPLVAKLTGGVPKGAIVGVGAALGLLFVGVVLLLVHRNAYSRGLVLEHVPEDCAQLTYIDVAGIATSDPVKPKLEKFFKNSKDLAEDEISHKGKKEKERYERALEALQRNGLAADSIREVAICEPTVDADAGESAREKTLLVVGGTFRKGDVLQGMKESTEAILKDEDACKIEDDDGLRMLKCSVAFLGSKKQPVYATLVESRVLVVSLDRKMVKSVRAAKDRSKLYGASKGEHVVLYRAKDSPSWDGGYGETKLKIGDKETVLTIEKHYDPDKGKSKLAQFKDGEELVKKKEQFLKTASEKCFSEKNPLEALAESVERTKVEAYDDGLRYEYKVSNKELAKVFAKLADADKEDMNHLMKTWWCVLDTVEPFAALPKY